MGTILILSSGIIGGITACKKPFLQSWIFLINLLIAFYIGCILASYVATELLTFGNLTLPVRNVICVIGILLIIFFIEEKIEDQIISNTEIELPLSGIVEKIFKFLFGFVSGCLIIAIVLWGANVIPAIKAWPPSEEIHQNSCKTLSAGVTATNILIFHKATPEELKSLTDIGIIYKPAQKKTDEAKSVPQKKIKKKRKKNTASQQVPANVSTSANGVNQGTAADDNPVKITTKKRKKKYTMPQPSQNQKADTTPIGNAADYSF